MKGLLDKLKAYFSSTAGIVSGAVAAALAAAVTAALSPLGDSMRDMIWPEKIVVDQDMSLAEKKSMPFRLVLTDASRGSGLSGGRVKLQPPDDAAVVLEGPKTFTFPAADGSIVVAPEGLTIEGRLPGKSRVLVSVLTNRGRRFSGHVDVETIATRPLPTNLDFSTSDWLITLNRRHGGMTVKEDRSHRFGGTAQLDDGTSYAVKGWRDGDAFHAEFRLSGSAAPGPIAYEIDGHYCEKRDWLIVNAKVASYRDGVRAPEPVPIQTISQRCPGFPDMLADLDGDGAFSASVATK